MVRLPASHPTPNLEDQASLFTSPGDRVAQLYPRTLGSSGTRDRYFPYPLTWALEGKLIYTDRKLNEIHAVYIVLNCAISLECYQILIVRNFLYLVHVHYRVRRCQWSRGLRRRSAAAWFLESRIRIPLEAWMFVCCVICCVVLCR
jgi:hypothetical protein